MRITVTTRHALEVDPSLRLRARRMVERIGRIAGRALAATVVLDTGAGRAVAEIRLECAGERMVVATASAADHRSALDRVQGRVRRQLRRIQARPRRLRHAVGIA